MSDMMPESVSTGLPAGDSDGNDGFNEAWKPLLEAIPADYHEKVIPTLKSWDQGINGRFQELHEQFEPYKPFVQSGIDPESLNQAWGVYNALNDNPTQFMGLLQSWMQEEGIAPNGGKEATGDTESDLDPRDLEIQRLNEQQSTIAQILVAQREEALAAQEDAELDAHLNALHAEATQQHGVDFDERIVMPLMQNGYSAEEAVEEYYNMVNQIRSQHSRPLAPRVMGGNNGSLPTTNVSLAKASDREVKDYIVQRLRAQQQAQGMGL